MLLNKLRFKTIFQLNMQCCGIT